MAIDGILASAAVGNFLKGLAAIWFQDRQLLNLGVGGVVDLVNAKAGDYKEARQLRRLLEDIEQELIDSLKRHLEDEYKDTDDHDLDVVVSYCMKKISSEEFYDACFENNLDSQSVFKYFSKSVRDHSRDVLRVNPLMSEQIFSFTVSQFIGVIHNIPTFSKDALKTILMDADVIIESVHNIELAIKAEKSRRQKEITQAEQIYRRKLIDKLNKITYFGLDARSLPKDYNLSIAYVNLTLSSSDSSELRADHDEVLGEAFRPEHRLVFVTGEPGSGKTTLLSWLAVHCAQMPEVSKTPSLVGKLPVFIRIRDYATEELPQGFDLISSVLGPAKDSLSTDWMKQALQEGRLAFFLDGFDEVTQGRRTDVIDWIKQILEAFPECSITLSTRPYTVSELNDLSISYGAAESHISVKPMDVDQVKTLINRWYDAFSRNRDLGERLEIARGRLHDRLEKNSALRTLVRNPLICSLICFVNADRDGFVPDNRGELYELSTETLLDRRDRERGIHSSLDIPLTKAHKAKIIEHIAEYFYKRMSEAVDKEDVCHSLKEFLPSLGIARDEAGSVLDHLAERSHIIRSVNVKQIDFTHKTFLEYFYAKRLISHRMTEVLRNNFFNDSFREVVNFSFSVGDPNLLEDLTKQIIQFIRSKSKSPDFTTNVLILQTAIKQTAELSPEIRRDAIVLLSRILPPKNYIDAENLSHAGEVIIEPLADYTDKKYEQYWEYIVHALINTFSESAFYTLSKYTRLGSTTVDRLALMGRRFFYSNTYVDRVLRHCKSIESLNVTDWGDLSVVFVLPNLSTVKISKFDDTWEDVNPVKMGAVTSLSLNGASRVKNLSIIEFFPNLEYLKVRDCPQLEDFSHLKNCPKLKHIELSCLGLETLNNFADLPALQYLDVSESTDITDVRALNRLLKLRKAFLPSSRLYDQVHIDLDKDDVEVIDEDILGDFGPTDGELEFIGAEEEVDREIYGESKNAKIDIDRLFFEIEQEGSEDD